jgi:tRNA-2-methylthio-N6-dimethylallyladenosine synthase
MKYFIKTFGCQQNTADSERVAQAYESRGHTLAKSYEDANFVIINTCMVRESAENRVYGLVNNLKKIKEEKLNNHEFYKIIVTGCMVGIAFRDKTGKFLNKIRKAMPGVDEFMPIEEVGFDHEPVRQDNVQAWVPISNGCNNFCTFCIVPFTRGREISRPYEDIIEECIHLKAKRYSKVMLLGQNVNSYGADLILGKENVHFMRDIGKTYFENQDKLDDVITKTVSTIRAKFTYNGREVEPVYVKHLGKMRIPTLFPYLLEDVARLDFEEVNFISSNPWDFSDELIDVISKYKNISRKIHLPVQSGDDNVLKRMNRWYSSKDYLNIIKKLRAKVPDIKITTDIIVGFCKETDDEFENTIKLSKEVGFDQAFISIYSERPMTAATKVMTDDVSHTVKKERWLKLDKLINARFRTQS